MVTGVVAGGDPPFTALLMYGTGPGLMVTMVIIITGTITYM
jgi:hypothetical protein